MRSKSRQQRNVQTLQWRWDYSKDDWEAILSAPDGEEYKLAHNAGTNVVAAQYGSESWSFRMRGSEVHVHRNGEDRPYATVQSREIKFAQGETVLMDSGKWYRLTLTEQLTFTKELDTLLVMRQTFWSRRRRRVRISTTAAGEAFPLRALLVLLGFHELVVRDMNC